MTSRTCCLTCFLSFCLFFPFSLTVRSRLKSVRAATSSDVTAAPAQPSCTSPAAKRGRKNRKDKTAVLLFSTVMPAEWKELPERQCAAWQQRRTNPRDPAELAPVPHSHRRSHHLLSRSEKRKEERQADFHLKIIKDTPAFTHHESWIVSIPLASLNLQPKCTV